MRNKWVQIQSILEKILSPGQVKVWLAPLVPSWENEELVLYAQSEFVAFFVRGSFLEHLEEAAASVLQYACKVRVEYAPGAANRIAKEEAITALACAAQGEEPTRASAVVAADFAPGGGCAPSTPVGLPPAARSLGGPRPLAVSPMATAAVQLALPRPAEETPAHAWRYSFDDFIVGPCNELAYAASRSICGEMLQSDVLFLSSAPGLGKTHLVHAVGKQLCKLNNKRRPQVAYVTAEEFATRFFQALKTQSTDQFKASFRHLDLLLLEDVHFLQGKEKMQAEFLATLKALGERGAKLVCTSSFAPSDLRQMDEQLLSRLCGGLFSAIEKPDEETRRRILRQKARVHQVLLPDDVEDLLALHIPADVRQIESCLQNLILKARLYQTGITRDMAWEVICQYAAQHPMLDIEAITTHVCRCFSLSREQLFSARRKQDYVSARNTAFYLARKHTELSLDAIGKYFKRTHSTVLKGIASLEREMNRETPLGRQIANTLSLIERNGNIGASLQ